MLNIAFFLFVALLFPLTDLWLYPRLQRATAEGVSGARVRYHLLGAVMLWLLGASSVTLVLRERQPWRDLRLDVASPIRLGAGLAVVIAYIAYVMTKRPALVRSPERLRRLVQKHAYAQALAPHTPAEAKTFALLSVSAGVWEEIVYRGFMLWFATMWIGLWPAAVATSLLFGVAHVYLGKKQIPRTAAAGLLFAVLAIATGSLLPGIVLHAFTDLFSGDLFYRASRSEALEQVGHERLRETIGNGADGAALLVE
jgi:hypothetical protein